MAGELIFECDICKERTPCNTVVPEGWVKLTRQIDGRINSVHACSPKCLMTLVAKLFGTQQPEVTKTYNNKRGKVTEPIADWDIEQDTLLLDTPKGWSQKAVIKVYNERYGHLNRTDWTIVNRLRELRENEHEHEPVQQPEKPTSNFTDEAITRSLDVIIENEEIKEADKPPVEVESTPKDDDFVQDDWLGKLINSSDETKSLNVEAKSVIYNVTVQNLKNHDELKLLVGWQFADEVIKNMPTDSDPLLPIKKVFAKVPWTDEQNEMLLNYPLGTNNSVFYKRYCEMFPETPRKQSAVNAQWRRLVGMKAAEERDNPKPKIEAPKPPPPVIEEPKIFASKDWLSTIINDHPSTRTLNFGGKEHVYNSILSRLRRKNFIEIKSIVSPQLYDAIMAGIPDNFSYAQSGIGKSIWKDKKEDSYFTPNLPLTETDRKIQDLPMNVQTDKIDLKTNVSDIKEITIMSDNKLGMLEELMFQSKTEAALVAAKKVWERDRRNPNSGLRNIFEMPNSPILRYDSKYVLFVNNSNYWFFMQKIKELVPVATINT